MGPTCWHKSKWEFRNYKKVTEDRGQDEHGCFLTQVGEYARDMGVLALFPLQVSKSPLLGKQVEMR